MWFFFWKNSDFEVWRKLMQFGLNNLSKQQRKASPSERRVLSLWFAGLHLLLKSPAGSVTNSLSRWAEVFPGSSLLEQCTENLQCLYVGRWLERELPQSWHKCWVQAPRVWLRFKRRCSIPEKRCSGQQIPALANPAPGLGGPGKAAAPGHPSECWLGCQVSLLISLSFW